MQCGHNDQTAMENIHTIIIYTLKKHILTSQPQIFYCLKL